MGSNILGIVTSVLGALATTVPRASAQATSSRTSSFVTSTSSAVATASAAAGVISTNVQSTILVIARDAASVSVASSGLNGYGIPFQTLLVPQAGVTLPTLNTTSGGNYGGIVIASQVAYDYGGTIGFQSALTADQWNTLYSYQLAYGVRMVQYDVSPPS